jgi:polar amino acid transport system substrate-binding protein
MFFTIKSEIRTVNMKKLIPLLLAVLIAVVTVACKQELHTNTPLSINDRPYTDFVGKKFAILDGTGYETFAESIFESKSIVIYETGNEGIKLLDSGAVDAIIGDYTACVPWVNSIGTDKYAVSVIPAEYARFDYAAMAKNDETAELFNTFLAEISADGTLADMSRRWVDNYDPDNIPAISENFKAKNGTGAGAYTIAINTECAPFIMPDKNGNPTGFEIELMTRFADSQGKSVEFSDTSFADIIPLYTSGEVDFVVAMCYDISGEDNNSGILFTDSYHDALLALVYKK